MNEWISPDEYPNLSSAKLIGIDLETRDEHLLTLGPGGVRDDGYVIGIALATHEAKWYFPIRHEAGGNVDPDNTLRWFRDVMSTNTPKVGANVIYDLEWLHTENITVNGLKYDVQIAEPLLDENLFSYSLETLAQKYLGRGKTEGILTEAAKLYGVSEKEAKSNMWRFHAKHVGAYAEDDADLAIQIFEKQRKLIEADQLETVLELETKLVDVLLQMRIRGIPVDIDKAERIRDEFSAELTSTFDKLHQISQTDVDIWSGKSLGQVCDNLGLSYTRTDKGNPSFESGWLETQEDIEFYKLLSKARKLDRAGAVFIQSKILDVAYKGRIYPRFRQVKGDDKGTRSGRFSSEGPNMQQVPARDPYIAPLVRSIFVAEEGCEWASLDYSQQEPRVTVHYATLCEFAGAAEAAKRYIENPKTDYHQFAADMVKEYSGITIDRKNVAKPINLGLAYGMGRKKLAVTLGLPISEADPILRAYHAALPYVKLLGDECAAVAMERGYIRTISGRRRRFNLFGPKGWKPGIVPKKYDDALAEWGDDIVAYFTHKSLNALVQGTSADMIKKAMLDCFNAGFVPHMTIHDELCFSVKNREELKQIRDLMEHAYELKVPIVADVSAGPSWGEVTKIEI